MLVVLMHNAMDARRASVLPLSGWLLVRAPISGPPGEHWNYFAPEDEWRRIDAFVSKSDCEAGRGSWYSTFTRDWNVDEFTARQSLRCVPGPE